MPETAIVDSMIEVEPGVYSVLLSNGRSHEVRVHKHPQAGWNVEVEGVTHTVEIRDPRERTKGAAGAGAAGAQKIVAPMPGKVVRVLVAVGDAVEPGQGLVVVEAMKMQNEMKSQKAGTVARVLCEAGATVAVGDTLIVIE